MSRPRRSPRSASSGSGFYFLDARRVPGHAYGRGCASTSGRSVGRGVVLPAMAEHDLLPHRINYANLWAMRRWGHTHHRPVAAARSTRGGAGHFASPTCSCRRGTGDTFYEGPGAPPREYADPYCTSCRCGGRSGRGRDHRPPRGHRVVVQGPRFSTRAIPAGTAPGLGVIKNRTLSPPGRSWELLRRDPSTRTRHRVKEAGSRRHSAEVFGSSIRTSTGPRLLFDVVEPFPTTGLQCGDAVGPCLDVAGVTEPP